MVEKCQNYIIYIFLILGGFAQYDYGPERNKEIYGSEKPPQYNLSKILAPVAVYYGENDVLITNEVTSNM